MARAYARNELIEFRLGAAGSWEPGVYIAKEGIGHWAERPNHSEVLLRGDDQVRPRSTLR